MRIYNNIPVASVLFGVGGKQKLRIVDFTDVLKFNWYGTDESNVPFEEVFCGEYRSGSSAIYRIDWCKIRGITAKDDTLTIYICSVKDKNE